MRLRIKSFGGLVVAAACVTALAACSSSTSSSNSSGSAQATGTPISGGTATFAELPATTPGTSRR
jgi:curli biogenesis system outer membrane secretion channel CsgG